MACNTVRYSLLFQQPSTLIIKLIVVMLQILLQLEPSSSNSHSVTYLAVGTHCINLEQVINSLIMNGLAALFNTREFPTVTDAGATRF